MKWHSAMMPCSHTYSPVSQNLGHIVWMNSGDLHRHYSALPRRKSFNTGNFF